jgi:putative ABC transport system permease protein
MDQLQGKKKRSTPVYLAVGEKYLELTKQKLSQGQFFGGSLENNNTVILAENVAQDLFGSSDPIGSTVTIRGNNFVIIGVLSPTQRL